MLMYKVFNYIVLQLLLSEFKIHTFRLTCQILEPNLGLNPVIRTVGFTSSIEESTYNKNKKFVSKVIVYFLWWQ